MKILVVLTGSDHLTLKDRAQKLTGFWAEEFVVPHEQFRDAGFQIDIATPGGVEPTVDQASFSLDMNAGNAQTVAHYHEYLAAVEELKHPLALQQIPEEQINAYAALFLPGGHGPMEDLAYSASLGRIIRQLHASEKLIVAVCHGSAGLLPAREDGQEWLFRGYQLTGFTNQEEAAVGLAGKLRMELETRIRELGGIFRAAPPMQPNVVVDRRLITGQNPASAAGVAREAIARLGVLVGG